MLIDWFTVVAQAINFLVLVWLMKRYLYGPLLKAIDERERRIAAELADADNQKSLAEQARLDYVHKNEALREQQDALLREASRKAELERQQLLESARQDANGLRTQLEQGLKNEYRDLRQSLAQRTQSEVLAIAKKTLADLAGADLEQRMVEVFTQRLAGLAEADKQALAGSEDAVMVQSAFSLSSAQRQAIEQALVQLGARGTPQFQTQANLVGGIELSLQGHKLAWSIADYLSSLEQELTQFQKTQPKAE